MSASSENNIPELPPSKINLETPEVNGEQNRGAPPGGLGSAVPDVRGAIEGTPESAVERAAADTSFGTNPGGGPGFNTNDRIDFDAPHAGEQCKVPQPAQETPAELQGPPTPPAQRILAEKRPSYVAGTLESQVHRNSQRTL